MPGDLSTDKLKLPNSLRCVSSFLCVFVFPCTNMYEWVGNKTHATYALNSMYSQFKQLQHCVPAQARRICHPRVLRIRHVQHCQPRSRASASTLQRKKDVTASRQSHGEIDRATLTVECKVCAFICTSNLTVYSSLDLLRRAVNSTSAQMTNPFAPVLSDADQVVLLQPRTDAFPAVQAQYQWH